MYTIAKKDNALLITSASKRIFIILFGLISFIIMTFLYMGYIHHKFVLETITGEERQIASYIYKNTFKQVAEKYELLAQNILADQEIIKAFERGDRAELLALTAPIYKRLLEKNPYMTIMHFHTRHTASFLRLHKPQKFADDLSDIRHMINKVNTLKTKQVGVEVGRYGIDYRLALPVFNKAGKHLGAFEFGISINYIFDLFSQEYNFTPLMLLKKESFQEIYEINKGMQIKEFSDEYYLLTMNTEAVPDLLNSDLLSQKYLMISSQGKDSMVFTVTDIMNVLNEEIGKLIFVKNLNFYTDEIEKIKRVTFALAVIILLFSFYFMRKTFNSYIAMVQHYKNILEIKNRTLLKLAHTDHLTKISNRQSIEKTLKKELLRAERYSRPLSLVMLDVDDFKTINDTCGHSAGDKVLRQLAKIISTAVRDTDHFGRWGGEEFIIVATETGMENAVILAEKIKMLLSKAALEGQTISCSIGVAQHIQGDNYETLINHADLAMYEAKNSGKNRVVVYSTAQGKNL